MLTVVWPVGNDVPSADDGWKSRKDATISSECYPQATWKALTWLTGSVVFVGATFATVAGRHRGAAWYTPIARRERWVKIRGSGCVTTTDWRFMKRRGNSKRWGWTTQHGTIQKSRRWAHAV